MSTRLLSSWPQHLHNCLILDCSLQFLKWRCFLFFFFIWTTCKHRKDFWRVRNLWSSRLSTLRLAEGFHSSISATAPPVPALGSSARAVSTLKMLSKRPSLPLLVQGEGGIRKGSVFDTTYVDTDGEKLFLESKGALHYLNTTWQSVAQPLIHL